MWYQVYKYVICITAMFLLLNNYVLADPNKHALKALEKGDFQKTEELLRKALSKDSLNPASYYISSVLYLVDSFPKFDIDTSYYLIKKGITQLDQFSEESEQRMEKLLDISRGDFLSHRYQVEKRGLARASSANSVLAFEEFLQNFQNDILKQHAIGMRDSLAYLSARKINSWQAFKNFLKKYPNAKQAEDARESYEWLLFKDKTAGNQLKDLESFYAIYKESPYRERVVDEIFIQSTVAGSAEVYAKFLQKYPNTKLTKRARDILYYLEAEAGDSLYQSLYFNDSLTEISAKKGGLWLPFIERGKIGFTDTNGAEQIAPTFDKVANEYSCYGLISDVLIGDSDEGNTLYDRNGHYIFSGFDDIEELGYGYTKFRIDDQFGLIHKSGFKVFNAVYEDVFLIGSSFVAFLKDDMWGIATMSGEEIYPPYFEDIEYYEGYVLLWKNGLLNIQNLATIADVFRKEKKLLTFEFDEVEIFEEGYLVCYGDQGEQLIDSILNIVIPMADHQIYLFNDDWYVRSDSGYQLFDKEAAVLRTEIFENIQSNRRWLAVQKSGKWTLFSKTDAIEPRFKLDSVKLISEEIVYFKDDLFQRIIFGQATEINVGNEDMIKPLLKAGNAELTNQIVVSSDEEQTVYLADGTKVFTIESDELYLVNESVYLVEKNSKKGLASKTGDWILKPDYSSIQKDTSSLVQLLKKGKIGAYDLSRRKLIEAAYSTAIARIGDGMYVINEDGEYGVIDVNKETIVEPGYKEIIPFAGNLALVRHDNVWGLLDITEDSVLLDGIYTYELLGTIPSPILKYRVEKGYGLYSHQYGHLLKPEYNDIRVVTNGEDPVYQAERFLKDADLYVTLFVNKFGERIISEAYREDEYEKIACDQ